MEITVTRSGILRYEGRCRRCALGRGGVGADKREGDGKTPTGRLPLRRVHYRPDRLDAPRTTLPLRALAERDGWCDAPKHPDYNTLVQLPHPAHHERLWRRDHIYDVIVELGYNDDPVVAGCGSAIFLHVARPEFTPTEGCVAIALADLLELLQACASGDGLTLTADLSGSEKSGNALAGC